MEPVFRSKRLCQKPAAQNLLADQGHHHGVFDVMIERIAVSDALQYQSRRAAEISRVFRPPVGEVLEVKVRE